MEMSEKTQKINLFAEKIKNSKSIVIITHYNPDGDAIGSLLGMCNFLKQYANVVPITPNAYPEFLSWMPGNENVLVYKKNPIEADKYILEADLIVSVDFNSIGRIDKIDEPYNKSKAFKVLLDHHPMPEDFADLVFSETDRSSAAELVYDVISQIDEQKINSDVADCILAGIMTDTGCFSFNSSKPETWRIVARLLELGANKDRIFNKVYENYTADRMKLMGFCLNERMKIFANGRAAMIYLSMKDLSLFEFNKGDTEGFVNIPFSIKGINVSALIVEFSDLIKLSLRSKGDFDVNLIARNHFNGGGHKNAAGGRVYNSLEQAKELFERVMNENAENLEYDFYA